VDMLCQGASTEWHVHSLSVIEEGQPPAFFDGGSVYTTAEQHSSSVHLQGMHAGSSDHQSCGGTASALRSRTAHSVDMSGLEATLRHTSLRPPSSDGHGPYSGEPAAAMRALMRTLETVCFKQGNAIKSLMTALLLAVSHGPGTGVALQIGG
jgi:hypothetical protein